MLTRGQVKRVEVDGRTYKVCECSNLFPVERNTRNQETSRKLCDRCREIRERRVAAELPDYQGRRQCADCLGYVGLDVGSITALDVNGRCHDCAKWHAKKTGRRALEATGVEFRGGLRFERVARRPARPVVGSGPLPAAERPPALVVDPPEPLAASLARVWAEAYEPQRHTQLDPPRPAVAPPEPIKDALAVAPPVAKTRQQNNRRRPALGEIVQFAMAWADKHGGVIDLREAAPDLPHTPTPWVERRIRRAGFRWIEGLRYAAPDTTRAG